MMHLFWAAAFALQLAATPTAPVPPSAAKEGSAITVVGKQDPKNKRVCKSPVATGSIMPKRTCRTVGEWEAITARSVAALDRMKREEEDRRMVEELRKSR
ncbi:MAG TPA: hypothetical protein VMN38_03435 [Sphingomicrobium sp.]|nr:hypothetical protein [Sphingomicrobium sp.]